MSIPLSTTGETGRLSLGVGYCFHKLSFGEIVRIGETGERLGASEPNDRAHNVILSLGYTGRIRAGLGLTFRSYKCTFATSGAGSGPYELNSSGTMFDFGALCQIPLCLGSVQTPSTERVVWSITPAAGLSFLNVGSDFEWISYYQKDPPPKTMRYGGSLAIECRRNDVALFSLTPLFEIEDIVLHGGSSVLHYSAEVGMYEIAYARAGVIDDDEASDRPIAYGFTLSSRGIAKLKAAAQDEGRDRAGRGLLSRLTIEISFAKYISNRDYLLSGAYFPMINVLAAL